MPILYRFTSERIRHDEPNLVRWRHRLRGPRESLKFNSETRALDLDFDTLYTDITTQSELHSANDDVIEDGGAVTGVYETWDDATPTEEPLVLDGIDSLALQVALLRDRIIRLENNG